MGKPEQDFYKHVKDKLVTIAREDNDDTGNIILMQYANRHAMEKDLSNFADAMLERRVNDNKSPISYEILHDMIDDSNVEKITVVFTTIPQQEYERAQERTIHKCKCCGDIDVKEEM